jgi:hypothetical protein
MLSVFAIVVSLLLIGLVVYFVVYDRKKVDSNTVLSGSQSGMTKSTLPYIPPPSFNQPEGQVYSYAMWILVKDFSYGYGRQRVIMTKGDSPGVYLDSTSNSLMVRVKTYGTTESILIPNIPAAKWIHLAIVVNQQAVDVYINGTLRQHHSLSQLPDLTDDKITVGSGWNGVVGNISYHPRALSYGEVRQMSQQEPPPDLEPKIAKPNYFDITWYTGRLNSK